MGKYVTNGKFRHQDGSNIGTIQGENKTQFDELLRHLSSLGGSYSATVEIEYYD